jgi:phenylacetate-CoA ligase
MDEAHLPAYAAAIMEHRPAFIEAMPSMLYPLARWLRSNPMPEWEHGLEGVLLYSENVYGFQSALFGEVFRCPVLQHYGQSERVLMAGSMPDDSRYFFWPTYGHFELLDGNDRPVTRPGEIGHIVGTSFDNQVMPFVRYRTGDLGTLSEAGPHPELPGFPVCERIEGRLQEFVINRDGRAISLLTVGAAHVPTLARIEAMQYQQDRAGELILRYVAATPLTAAELEHAARAIDAKTGCTVTTVAVETIARTRSGKQLMLIQNLDVSAHVGHEVLRASQ